MDDPIEVLRESRRIAVVGCSATPGKDAHEVPRMMAEMGYDIVPVNPHADKIFGRQAYRTLAEVPGPVDMVNVFRPPAEAAGVARQAVAKGARSLWLQTGITSVEAEQIATAAGMRYVENACLRVVVRYVR